MPATLLTRDAVPAVSRENVEIVTRVVELAWTENFDSYAFSMGQVREVGDLFLATGRQTASGKGSGVPVEMTFPMLFTVCNAAISDVRLYLSEEDALQAAALSEFGGEQTGF